MKYLRFKKIKQTILIVLLLSVYPLAHPHSGGTNGDGCHTNRKTGDYHCHNSPKRTIYSPPKAAAPVVSPSPPSTKEDQIQCTVVSITDGDTFMCLTKNTQKITVRLAQIDAPEKGHPFYNQAKTTLGKLIHNRNVILKNISKDRYQRTVATVWLNGQDICLEMVRLGQSQVHHQYVKDDHYYSIEERAKENQMGIWAVETDIDDNQNFDYPVILG